MGNWQEKVEQRLREERAQAQETERKKAQEENEERLRREQQRAQQKTEARKIIARGKEILSLLDRLNVRQKLEEIRRELWRGLGTVRETTELPPEDHPIVNYGGKNPMPFEFRRSIGLYFESAYGILVPDQYKEVTHTQTGYREVWGSGADAGYTTSEYGTWHDTEKVLASLKEVDETAGSSLVIAINARLNDPTKEVVMLDLRDQITGSLGIVFEGSSYHFTAAPYSLYRMPSIDPKTGLQTAAKILDDFLLESGTGRASGGLFPHQFGDIVSRGNSATLSKLEQSRQKLPWHKKLF